MNDLISHQEAIDAIDILKRNYPSSCYEDLRKAVDIAIKALSEQSEEIIPHRNYKYLSDYWCECGWHLGKKGGVKYCSECGRKVNWDGRFN